MPGDGVVYVQAMKRTPDTVEHHHPEQAIVGSAVVNGGSGGSGDSPPIECPARMKFCGSVP